MAIMTWTDVPELDIAQEKQKCNFEVQREDLHSDENRLASKFKLISVRMPGEADFIRLGEVNANRPFIAYPDAIDWLNEQLDAVDADYKLFRSEVEHKTKALYQQYIFNSEITSPDGHGIAPMVMLRASYNGWRPAMEIHLGTYRYVCSNGCIVQAGGMESIRVNSHNWTQLGKVGLGDRFQSAMGGLQDISNLYISLDNIPLSEKYREIFTAKAFPVSLRKKVLAALERDGKVEITKSAEDCGKKKEPPLKAVLLDEPDLRPESIAGSVNIIEDTNLWNVYNVFTNTTTMGSPHSAKFITDSQKINKVFSKIAA